MRIWDGPKPPLYGLRSGLSFQRSRLALSLRLTDGEFHQVRLPMGIMEFFEQHVRPRLWDEVAKSIVLIILIGTGYISEVSIFLIVLCCFGLWAIWPWALLGRERLKKAYEKAANHEEWARHERTSFGRRLVCGVTWSHTSALCPGPRPIRVSID